MHQTLNSIRLGDISKCIEQSKRMVQEGKRQEEERLKENLCGKGKIVCVVKMVKVLVSVSVSVSASEIQVAFCLLFWL